MWNKVMDRWWKMESSGEGGEGGKKKVVDGTWKAGGKRQKAGRERKDTMIMIILQQLYITFYYFLGESLPGYKLLERTRSSEEAKNPNLASFIPQQQFGGLVVTHKLFIPLRG